MSWWSRERRSLPLADLDAFILERRQHMNDEMTRRGLELPDPADMLPPNWRELPEKYRRALYAATWADLGVNIGYLNDRRREPEWVQDPLPLAEFQPVFTATAASGWCTPPREGSF